MLSSETSHQGCVQPSPPAMCPPTNLTCCLHQRTPQHRWRSACSYKHMCARGNDSSTVSVVIWARACYVGAVFVCHASVRSYAHTGSSTIMQFVTFAIASFQNVRAVERMQTQTPESNFCLLRAPRARASYFQLAVTPLQRIRRAEP